MSPEKPPVQFCVYLIGHCHETVTSANAQKTVTREMREDFLVWADFPKSVRSSLKPYSEADTLLRINMSSA